MSTYTSAAAFSEPAGLTLRNVKLKTEALDFFQLPVAVEEAVVGSLHVRVSHCLLCWKQEHHLTIMHAVN